MKHCLLLLMLISPVALADAVNIHQFPRGSALIATNGSLLRWRNVAPQMVT